MVSAVEVVGLRLMKLCAWLRIAKRRLLAGAGFVGQGRSVLGHSHLILRTTLEKPRQEIHHNLVTGTAMKLVFTHNIFQMII